MTVTGGADAGNLNAVLGFGSQLFVLEHLKILGNISKRQNVLMTSNGS